MLDQSFNLSDSNVLDDIFQLPTLGVGSGLGRSDLITPFVRKSLQGLDSDFLSNSLEEYQLELKNRWQSSESLSSWPQDGDFLTGQSSFVGLVSSVDLAGNTLATARAITVGSSTTSYTDWVGSTDTNDYYRFTLANSSNFNLGLTGLTADADVRLLNSSGSFIASSTNGGTASESITRQLSAGTYYIRVYPYQSANTNYNLAVSATSIDLAGNTLATARAITVGSSTTSYTDWVGSTDTNDYYSFSLANSSNFNLSLTGMTADGDVQLLNSGGSVIASSTNGGTASESITSQLSAGTYYIRVYPYQSANTNYNLAVSATSGGGGTGFNSTYGYGLVNAAAAVAQAISQPTFADVPNLGGNNWGNDMVNAPEAWARGYTGQGVTVAVIDSGVDISHQDLSNNIWGNTGEIAGNGIDDDGNGYIDDINGWNFGVGQNNNNVLPGTNSSGQGHGTHVAGTIAAANNGIGMTGVAYNSRIMAIRMGDVDSQGRFTNGGNLAQAIRYAVDNGARVINMSLGWSDSTALRDALAYAASRNVITVSAAGNSSLSSPGTPAYYATQYGLSVGAVDSSRTIASFSNRAGTNSSMQHVMAPGVSVYSTVPGNGYGLKSGTSMAAPHVAGVVALMLGANPNLTHAQVRSILTSSAVRLA
ncbi:Similar to tr/Q3M5S2/Q3M5S2_ANAVT Peptidase S8 and S53 [Microcystis aeruginosa PCC 9432]|uniref:Similar to tr/Q3M5S2/Q3M5S2_ANAVT Peptidase S8 and S53 n=1 Tax=Microcystis aeruginosa PCC 9432 TaxID=1160280 RepID=A0A830ZRH2_MICAE|nr:S8 family serine peptidase [Microcystis aeruginosa]TRT97649.1 MAG: peptidase S8 [Microcystis aeruginosa Ma_OC_LR_19540900_S633]CCH95670.1 Similar to tr/Q3M5S2/Q3M5S2_ANAVT Peptidase S8 and S53 [Microcystis aeruginosa PCC 9432]